MRKRKFNGGLKVQRLGLEWDPVRAERRHGWFRVTMVIIFSMIIVAIVGWLTH